MGQRIIIRNNFSSMKNNIKTTFQINKNYLLLVFLFFICTLDGSLSILVDPPSLNFEEQPLATYTEQRITITNNVDRRKAQIQDLLRSNSENTENKENLQQTNDLGNFNNRNIVLEGKTTKSTDTHVLSTCGDFGCSSTTISNSSPISQKSETTSLPTSPISNEKFETWVRLDPIRINSKKSSVDFIVKSTFDSDTQLLMPDEKAYIDVTFFPKLIQDYHAEFVISYQKSVMKRFEDGQTKVHEEYGDIEKYTVSINAKGIHNSYLPHSFVSNNGLNIHRRILHHNATYTNPLYFKNPYSTPMQITRIAGTADCMHIDWVGNDNDLIDKSMKNGKRKKEEMTVHDSYSHNWELKPWEFKPIAYYSYMPSLCSSDSRELESANANKYSREKFYNKPNQDATNYFVFEFLSDPTQTLELSKNVKENLDKIPSRFLLPIHVTISRKPGVYSLEYILDFGVLWYDRDPVRQVENERMYTNPENFKQKISMKSWWAHPSNNSLAETVPKLTPYKRSLDIRVFSMCKPHTKWQDIQKQYFENSLPDFVSIKYNEELLTSPNQPRISIPCSSNENVNENAITLGTLTFDASKIPARNPGGFVEGFLSYQDKSVKSTLSADTAALNFQLLGQVYTGKGIEVFNSTQLFFDIDKGSSTRDVWLINSYDQEIFIESMVMIPTKLEKLDNKFQRNSEKSKYRKLKKVF